MRALLSVKKWDSSCRHQSLCYHTRHLSSNVNDNRNMANIVQGSSLLTNTGVARAQPTLFHLLGLRSLPFWTPQHEPNVTSERGGKVANPPLTVAYNDPTVKSVIEFVESHYETIKMEYIDAVEKDKKFLKSDYDVSFSDSDNEHASLHKGEWDWHSYLLKGQYQDYFKRACPMTASVIDELRQNGLLFDSTPFSFVFFSSLSGGGTIQPHYGPMNLRLRVHLPIILPAKSKDFGLRCGHQTRRWVEGKAIVLDDAFEHEVWNHTDEKRVLLLFDIWHPDVQSHERNNVTNMFTFAREQGWLK